MSGARRCLVVHPGAIGDVLSALPALVHLRRLGFDRVLATAPRLAALLGACGAVEATVDFDGLGLHRLFTDPLDGWALAPLSGFDAVVSWFGAGNPAYVESLSRLGRPVVVARAVPAPGVCQPVSAHLVDTLAPLGPPPTTLPVVRLIPPAAARAGATAWLGERGLRPGEPVLLQAGAGSPVKVWPGFPALAGRLRRGGQPVVVVAGPADAAALASILAEGVIEPEMVARDGSLVELGALAAVARGFVGNDSGPTHLAAAVGCPTLALFGPSDPRIWAPAGAQVRALGGRGPAAPDPWAGLAVDRVEAALDALLSGGAPAVRSPA